MKSMRGADSPSWLTWLLLALMVLLWGVSWPAMKIALNVIPPLWLGVIRFLSGSLCLFLFLACRKGLTLPARQDLPILLSVGCLQMLAFTALGLVAMQYTDVSRAALLAYTTPLWGVIISGIFFRQIPSWVQLCALLTGLLGIALVCSPYELNWHTPGVLKGCLLLLLAAGCWSVVIFHVRHHRWVQSPLALAPWQMLFATVPMFILALIFEGEPKGITFTPFLFSLLVFIGPVATSICFVISTACGRKVSSFVMSNFTLGVPVVGNIASLFILGTTMSLSFKAGLLLVVLGSLLAIYAGTRIQGHRLP
jgi:drug/metabolite transporter (DMT)-like permease